MPGHHRHAYRPKIRDPDYLGDAEKRRPPGDYSAKQAEYP